MESVDDDYEFYYRVIYSDGDEEEYDDDDLDRIVMLPPKRATNENSISYKNSSLPKLKKKDALSLWQIQGLQESSAKSCSLMINGLPDVLGKHTKKMADFFLFVFERQLIWVRRNQGLSPPFSANPVFQDFWFCNNYRELDRGTAFFHAHVLDLRASRKKKWTRQEWLTEILWASYAYRCVNRIESFEACGFPSRDNPSDFFKRTRKYRASNNTFFTGAHQTTTYANYMEDIEKVLKSKAALLHEIVEKILKTDEKEDWQEALERFPDVGPFIAWQILCDLHESGCVEVKDDDFYCALGPGAEKGLTCIFGPSNEVESRLDQAMSLVQYQDVFYQSLGLDFPYWNGSALTIKEIEHALCEYSKFKRIQADLQNNRKVTGKRRRKSRSKYDLNKRCRDCHVNSKAGLLCDTCLHFFCSECVPPTEHVSWICSYCRAFDPAYLA